MTFFPRLWECPQENKRKIYYFCWCFPCMFVCTFCKNKVHRKHVYERLRLKGKQLWLCCMQWGKPLPKPITRQQLYTRSILLIFTTIHRHSTVLNTHRENYQRNWNSGRYIMIKAFSLSIIPSMNYIAYACVPFVYACTIVDLRVKKKCARWCWRCAFILVKRYGFLCGVYVFLDS